MTFQRPRANRTLKTAERSELLRRYYDHYRQIGNHDPAELNKKVARGAFHELLDEIGSLLLDRSKALASSTGVVRDFLKENPLPEPLEGLLPDDFRVFCLALNALKQWVSAEQAATDRYLLGGTGRAQCRNAATTCLVTGDPLIAKSIELHHPVRDGRPPVPLSKRGHELVESQAPARNDSSVRSRLLALRKQGNRSWVCLRRGCLDLLGRTVAHSTPKVAASSRSFARKASATTGLSYEQLLTWLNDQRL
jgi:hypothetical protein